MRSNKVHRAMGCITDLVEKEKEYSKSSTITSKTNSNSKTVRRKKVKDEINIMINIYIIQSYQLYLHDDIL